MASLEISFFCSVHPHMELVSHPHRADSSLEHIYTVVEPCPLCFEATHRNGVLVGRKQALEEIQQLGEGVENVR